ncbi:hypothetical protein HY994_05065 [Candidatus Micrarchaeota archaeon]|nr:hypothetical protein [Candidatus Micrarchaeota archaeon]
MTHEHHTHPVHHPHSGHHQAKKKAPIKCDNCGVNVAECKCQTGCCGGACPNCNF